MESAKSHVTNPQRSRRIVPRKAGETTEVPHLYLHAGIYFAPDGCPYDWPWDDEAGSEESDAEWPPGWSKATQNWWRLTVARPHWLWDAHDPLPVGEGWRGPGSTNRRALRKFRRRTQPPTQRAPDLRPTYPGPIPLDSSSPPPDRLAIDNVTPRDSPLLCRAGWGERGGKHLGNVRLGGWARDLTHDGDVEPNPGPEDIVTNGVSLGQNRRPIIQVQLGPGFLVLGVHTGGQMTDAPAIGAYTLQCLICESIFKEVPPSVAQAHRRTCYGSIVSPLQGTDSLGGVAYLSIDTAGHVEWTPVEEYKSRYPWAPIPVGPLQFVTKLRESPEEVDEGESLEGPGADGFEPPHKKPRRDGMAHPVYVPRCLPPAARGDLYFRSLRNIYMEKGGFSQFTLGLPDPESPPYQPPPGTTSSSSPAESGARATSEEAARMLQTLYNSDLLTVVPTENRLSPAIISFTCTWCLIRCERATIAQAYDHHVACAQQALSSSDSSPPALRQTLSRGILPPNGGLSLGHLGRAQPPRPVSEWQRDLTQDGDVESNPGPGPGPTLNHILHCPVGHCVRSAQSGNPGWGDAQALMNHVRSVHLSAGQPIPATFLEKHGIRVCEACKDFVKVGKACTRPRCALSQMTLLAAAFGPRGMQPHPMEQSSTPCLQAEPDGWSALELMQLRTPIQRRVPIPCATVFALSLATLISSFVRTQSWESFYRLLLFPSVALQAPGRGGKARRGEGAWKCREGCLRAMQDSLVNLRHSLTPEDEPPAPRRSKRLGKRLRPPDDRDPLNDEDNESRNVDEDLFPPRTVDAARAMVAEGAPGRAFKLFTSAGIHDPSDPDVFQKLLALHPTGNLILCPEPAPRSVLGAWPDEEVSAMRAIIHSFPPASAGGPSGLRPQHLVDCLGSASTHAQSLLLEALCELCHRGLEGSLAPRAVAYLCAARLIPLKKADGGVRPIAIGETLRRIIAKFALRRPASSRAQCWMSPLQTAFVRGSPCETVGMGVQELVHQLSGREDWGLLQVDVRNAFNTLQRETILGAVATHAPELTAWVRQTLQPAPLLCGREVVWSTQGVQQGDPMGPFLFALGIQDVINLLPKDMLLHRWYLDDGVLMGTLPQLHHAIELLEAHFPQRGLVVNYSKTTLWGPVATPPRIATAPNGSRLRSTSLRPIGDVMRVLGVPVAASGNELAMLAYLDAQATRIQADMHRVSKVPDKQVAHSVLRNCLGPVQAQFLLRTVDHSMGKEFAARIETAQRSAWERLLGTQLTPQAWMQSTLPISKGGCWL